MRSSLHLLALLAPLAMVAPTLAQEAKPTPAPSTLPGGANSLNEAHGDWTVSCAMAGDKKDCVLTQALGDNQTGQRVLALELAMTASNDAEGMLLAPFGLRLGEGIKLSLDGRDLGTPRPFYTCIATGCLVPIQFDAAALAVLKAGSKLEVNAASANNGEPIKLSLSLTGFTAALDRVVALGK